MVCYHHHLGDRIEFYNSFPLLDNEDKSPILKYFVNKDLNLLQKQMSITRYEHPFGFNLFNKHPNFYLPIKLRVYLEGRFAYYLPSLPKVR